MSRIEFELRLTQININPDSIRSKFVACSKYILVILYLIRFMWSLASKWKLVYSHYSWLSQVGKMAELIEIRSAVQNWVRCHSNSHLIWSIQLNVKYSVSTGHHRRKTNIPTAFLILNCMWISAFGELQFEIPTIVAAPISLQFLKVHLKINQTGHVRQGDLCPTMKVNNRTKYWFHQVIE